MKTDNVLKRELTTYCELYWWNHGKKTLSFKGELHQLLTDFRITYCKRKTEFDGFFNFKFKNLNGITFTIKCAKEDFPFYAKKFIQMDLVRMGDKSQLYVSGTIRSTVTVNF